MRVIIVTGLSGSGKSVALHTLEDEGFYCVDNLPSSMLPELIKRLTESSTLRHDSVAVGIDARSEPESISELVDIIKTLNQVDLSIEILFLETNQETLLKRFSETRRKHPLTSKGTPLITAIRKEADFLLMMKENADLVIDTSALNLHQLREIILKRMVGRKTESLALLFQSFGFKYGPPRSTDFIFDVRCLPNPYWDPAIRSFTGLDEPVIKFLENHEMVTDMYSSIFTFVDKWLPVFESENRSYLTISVGCTGGRHRSVYLSNRLQTHFSSKLDNVSVRHRELG